MKALRTPEEFLKDYISKTPTKTYWSHYELYRLLRSYGCEALKAAAENAKALYSYEPCEHEDLDDYDCKSYLKKNISAYVDKDSILNLMPKP